MNALQGGVRGDLGKTPEKILGVPAKEATGEHVAKLSECGRENRKAINASSVVGYCHILVRCASVSCFFVFDCM